MVEREQRPATEEEQRTLARWSGWGALPVIFNPRPARAAFGEGGAEEEKFERATARWDAVSDLREQIRGLLSEDDWAAARRNTINAHYTDADLARSIWGAVRRLGFTGGRVLEPGSGSGNFIGFAPILTATPVQMTGVEVEPTTAAIARHLYPDAEIITSGLEEVELADGGFDGVVGNVPFGHYKRFDKVHNPDLKLSIHDHFVLKALHATRPGGVVALITSRYTLDAETPDARERMYQLGDLVGAVRLPARAHMAAAGTDVVTDVLFLRRRMPGEEPGDTAWLTSTKRVLPGHEAELAVNSYFDAHPEYVLGELRAGSRQWGPEVTVVGRTDQAPADALAAAAAAISVEARAAGLLAGADQRTEPVQTIVPGGTEGALGLDAEGNPTIIDGGRPVPLEIHADQRDQLVQLLRLKSLTLALYEAEADTPEPGETPQLAAMRAELRVAWRDYRKSHPPLTKPRQHYVFTPSEARAKATEQGLKDVPAAWKQRTAFAWIEDDPDASLLFGLEEWDERAGKGIEQKVLRARVLEPRVLPTRANSHEDAIALAMEYDGGRLDMTRVAFLLGLDEESAAAQCADAGLAYRDPLQHDAWEPRHRYLSGNVRTKLAAARERAAEDPTFQGNVSALERVQPADLAPSEIKAKIGAPWIPVDVYNDFLTSLGFTDASVLHAGGTVWEVRGAKNGDLARTEWGTGSRPTQDLFTALLRQADSTIQVTYRDQEGRTYVDKAATDEAQEKARLITDAFEDWVWADESRAARLAKVYNEQFNNLVLPEYSGSALTLPGLISGWTMKEHQNAAIRRIVNEPTALLAHVVGAGKTATMAAGAMELRRTGLARKPCLIVPNHMLKQWSSEFRQLYPNAKILAITASDLNKKRRAKFMGRIAGGDWDAVILTHEAFNRVPLRPDTQRDYLDRETKSLRDQLDAAADAGMHRNTVKQIEESIANAEAKLQQQIEAMGDDNGVFLEDTGVDYLFLDEAHEYKNLRTVSAIPGAAIQGSAKATKLHMVIDYLRATNDSDRVATLATGTPIANSVTEAYVLKRYLAPQILAEMGLDAFDNWAATFGEVVSQLEPDPKGDGYKYKARFSRFFNVPELMAAYRVFADVQMAEDLDLPTPPVLENEDGQRGETILIPPTPAQRQFIKELPHQPWVRKPGGVLKALGEGLRASVDLDLVDATQALRSLGLSITSDDLSSTDPLSGERVLDLDKVADLADAAATDMRTLGGSKEMGSKIPYAAEKIAEVWQETKDIVYPTARDDPTPQQLPGGLQLVFLDEGTPGSTAKHAADLYADLRDELVARGMPRESIRFIHEAGTDRKKEKLFADCRSGRVRVLVGSTAKMGTGTNIQDRAVALHHLSYPWRPADMAQRDGRIERRGNLNAPWIDNTPDHVRILYYITERTFDEFRLTTLARKARFIGQIQRKDFSAREIEDIGADAINLGMLSALASGDPAILQLAEATAERARLQGLARSWDRQQDTRTQLLADIDDFLARVDPALEGMRAAVPNRKPTTGDHFAMTVGDATYRSRDAAANALGAAMVSVAKDQSLRPGERVPVGTFGGQDFHAEIAYGASGRRQMRLRFGWGHVVPMGHREDRAQWQASSVTQSNGRGAIQSLEHFLNHLEDDLSKLEKSAEALGGRREETADNLRPKDENPYRIQARSKGREEKALGKLVVANEKEAALAERVEVAASANPDAAEEINEELEALRAHIANLRQIITDEHEVQARARGLTQEENRSDDTPHPDAPTPAEKAAAEEDTAGRSTPTTSAGGAEPRQEDPPAEAQDQPGTDTGPVQVDPEPAVSDEPGAEASSGTLAPEASGDGPADGPEPTEQQLQEPVDDLLDGTAEPEDEASGPGSDQENAPGTAVEQDPRVAVPEGYQPFSDATVRLLPGDVVRAGWRQYMEDRHLRYRTLVIVEGPDYSDGYYICRHQNGRGTLRVHPREIVAVPDGSRLLEPGTPAAQEAPAPAPQETTGQEQAPLQDLIDLFGDQVSVAHIGGEPAGQLTEPAESEQQTGPSPAFARCVAVLRHYEPLLRRHKLSGREAAAFMDRPGAGYRYEEGNPLPELMAELGKVAERVGGSYRTSYNEWVNYSVGDRRARQSDTLTNLNLDLMTLYAGETEPLFLVDLEAILAAPGTVVELPSEAEVAAEEAAAARIVISHDTEGTEVRNTPRGGDQRIRDALNDLGFNWSRRQQKWYMRRNTPWDDRDTAVRGLRAAFERLGVTYTYNGPDPAPEPEGAAPAVQETTSVGDAPDGVQQPEAAEPASSAADEPAPAADSEPAPETQPIPPAADGEPDTAPADTTAPPDRPEEANAEGADTGSAAEDTVIVQTPDGPGTVIGTDDGDLVLVTTQSGTRVWEISDVQWPDDAHRPEAAERASRERRNAADAAQAATSEGIELRYGNGNRLVDLDTEAGHGTVIDADGAVLGWVRARLGDDGRRYWWAQDSRGGAPDDMPFAETLPPSAGVPAIRAAGRIRSDVLLISEPASRSPITAEFAAREVRLTTAQVRELRRLVLDATYSDGDPIEPPEWVASHRKYILNTAQMQALGDAAQAAADAFPGVTAEERRTARVLRNATERFEFEVYDTARWRATIPPIGETDPYAGPYQPRPRPQTTEEPQETAGVPAPAPEPVTTERQLSAAEQGEAEMPAESSAPEAAQPQPSDGEEADTPAPVIPAPDSALVEDADPGPAEAATGETGAADNEGTPTDIFPSETPETPAPERRPGGRRRISRREPASYPGAEGGPERGRIGVYGHAGPGECDRCGNPETDRYTMVWEWRHDAEDGGVMSAECGSCVELTTSLPYKEYRRQADVAEARRDGRRIAPVPYVGADVTASRTAENEWTYVHQPTGTRYRLAKETPSGYRGFVLRDLYGISHGTCISTSSGYELAERAALGRTAETHPNSSDDWVSFSYRTDAGKLLLHEGESIRSHQPNSPRGGGPFEHGPRWDVTVGTVDYQVELVYQPGQRGEDGHRLEATGPDGISRRHVHWDGVMEWARERARVPQPTVVPLGAPLRHAEEALTAAEQVRSAVQRRSTTDSLDHARQAWDRARASYEAGRLSEGDGHLAVARSHAIMARYTESRHADFQPLMDAVRRFHDAVDEVLYPGGAGWRPSVGDYVRARHQYVPESEGFWMKVTAIGADGIHVESGMTGDAKAVVPPSALGPHADLPWQEQPSRAPDEPRAADQERRELLGMPAQAVPDPGHPQLAQAQSGPADSSEEQLDLFAASAPQAPASVPEEAEAPAAESGEYSLDLVDGESIRYRGDLDGRYEVTLPGTGYLLFLPSVEYRRTKWAVALSDDSMSPKRLRRFDDPSEIMPWMRAHASKQQTGYVFRDGAWAAAPQTLTPGPSAETAAAQDGQLPFLGEQERAVDQPDAPETATTETGSAAAAEEPGPVQPGPVIPEPPATQSEPDPEKSREQLFQEAVDDLFAGAEPETGPGATQEETPAPASAPPADDTFTQDASADAPIEAQGAQPESVPEPSPPQPEPAPAPAAAEEEPAPPGPPAGAPEPTTDGGEMATPPSTTDTDDAVPVEDPPEPQPFTYITPLPADPAYELHLTGVDGQSPSSGELRYGETMIAAVRLSASGRWFARLAVDGMPADVSGLNGSPLEAAHQGAVMFAVVTGEPYGEPPAAADVREGQSQADVLRSELRTAAFQHLSAITEAAARASEGYGESLLFQALDAQLRRLGAAVLEEHGSRQMAANLLGVQEAVNAWGGALPTDPALEERQHLAFPLLNLLRETTRLRGRLQATLDAAQADREALREQEAAAAPVAPAEPVREESEQQTPPTPAAPEPVRGPVVTLGFREASDGQLAAEVHTVEASQGLVLPGVTVVDVPGMPLPATVQVPMLRRSPQQAEHLVSEEETRTWLAEQLVDGPLAQAWSVDAVRETLVVVATDILREGQAPTVDEVAAWLVATAAEQDGLLQAAHAAATIKDFAPAFARAADGLVADGGSEFLVWRYLGDSEGNRRLDVLALATPDAYEQLRALTAPADVPGPERSVAPSPTDPSAPTPDAPEDPEMATSAGRTTPEAEQPARDEKAELDSEWRQLDEELQEDAVAEAEAQREFFQGEDESKAAGEGGDGRAESTAESAEGLAEPPGDLPLFTGPEDASEPAEDRPLDIIGEFEAVKEAWNDHVPAEKGSGDDLFADVQADLASLQQLLAEAVAEAKSEPEVPPAALTQPAAAAEPVPPVASSAGEQEAAPEDRDPKKAAAAVNIALRQADEHAPALQDLPEWQRLQTVRGAFSNLVKVMWKRAGEHAGKLMEDSRVAGFLRRTSLWVCEKVASLAQRGANRLRQDDEQSTQKRRDLPSADALLRLGGAALEYRGPRGGGSTPPPASEVPDVNNIPAMRTMGEALARPMPGATKQVSTAAARGRSTTTSKRSAKGAKKSANGSGEQAGHLRRGGEQQPAPKPNPQR
ncbi:SNF2-related protein [Streptomyces sp. NPDC048213]|uniref:SNF2-related protein n=1 Tax=Streptomyces sp. NPDC048213 TaxID=3160984 RepID=UPI0033F48303